MSATPAVLPLPVRPRWMGWALPERLECAQGHHVPRNTFVFTDAVVRCKHRREQGGRECGRLLYLLAATALRGGERPRAIFVAEVTHAEVLMIEQLQLDPWQVLALLGATIREEPDHAHSA